MPGDKQELETFRAGKEKTDADLAELKSYQDHQAVADAEHDELLGFRAIKVAAATMQIKEDEAQAISDDEGWVTREVRFLPLEAGDILRHAGTWFKFNPKTTNWEAINPDVPEGF